MPKSIRTVLPGQLAVLVLLCLGAPSLAFSAGQDATSKQQPKSASSGDGKVSDPVVEQLDLTEEVVKDILSDLKIGIEARDVKQVLAVFELQEPGSSSALQNQMSAFFRQYDPILFRYQVVQVISEKDHGYVTAEIDMDAMPSDDSQVALRRTRQMRFQIKREDTGWKITGFSPGDFFGQ